MTACIETSMDDFDPHEARKHKKLLAHILATAIADACATSLDVPQHQQRGAYGWITEWERDADRKEAFSFPWVCEALDLDPEVIRKGIVRAGMSIVHKGSSQSINRLVDSMCDDADEEISKLPRKSRA